MIPGAWHFALRYEILLYEFLRTIGSSDRTFYHVLRSFDTSNHLTVLWLTTLVPIVQSLATWRRLVSGVIVFRSVSPLTRTTPAEKSEE